MQQEERGRYRHLQDRAPAQEEMEVRSTIQAIAVEHRRRYGYRRITAELHRRGMVVNHKRVARMMREDNLLAVQPRTFRVTTDSAHDLEVFLNVIGYRVSVERPVQERRSALARGGVA